MIAVHQNAAISGALNFCKSKPCYRASTIGNDISCSDAVLLQVTNDEAAHLVIGYLANKAGLHAQSGHANANISRRTSDILREGNRILHWTVDFIRVQIYTKSSNGDKIQLFPLIE
ncbi:hypothetical protein D3C78_1195600 [compost metagenome]